MEEGIIVRYDGTKEQFLLEDISQYNGRLVIISGDVDGVAEGFYVDGVDEDGNVSGKYFDLSGEHVKIALIGNSANDSMLPKTITGALAYTDALKGLSDDDYQKVTVYGVKNYALVAAQTAKREAIEHVEKQGFAKDLTGVVEPTAEEFTFRPSAGDKSIRDESAVIRRIKGNTSVWGQKLQSIPTRENFEGVTTFYDSSTNECVIQNISRTTPYMSGSTRWEIKPDLYPIVGHKYAIFSDRYYKGVGVYQLPGVFWEVNTIFETNNSSIVYFRLDKTFDFINTCPVGSEVRLKINIVDLTELYGKGNEPTTIEEFKKLYPESYYPYCEPEVRSMTATGIETVGFNQWDEEWESGLLSSAGEPTANSNGTRSVNFIPVIPNEVYYCNSNITSTHVFTYDINYNFVKTIYNWERKKTITIPDNVSFIKITFGDNTYPTTSITKKICINLSHSGVRNGEYEPYEKNVRMLPEIAKYFPNGMHGIGDVYDEINEEYAIQRLGVRTYEDGDSDNTNVKTDGSTTVYILAEPIVTPITEPLQLDYKVADFGTEKMLSDTPSSPFRAETVYQFNAEGRIRDNSRNIERIESLLNTKGDVLDYIYVADFSVVDLVMGSISKSLIDANVQALVSAINEDKIIIIPNGSGGICVANTEFDSEDMYMRITPPTGYSRIDVKIVIGDMAIDGNNVTLTKVETLPMVTSLSTAASSESIDPNTVYVYPATQKLGKTFVLQTDSMSPDAENIWRIRFGVDMYSTGTYEVSVPSRYGLVWQNGKAPTFVNGYWYELSFRLIGSVFLGECKEF